MCMNYISAKILTQFLKLARALHRYFTKENKWMTNKFLQQQPKHIWPE